jgi:dTDP-4-dehydrorhamnose 3,5-epimerase
VKIVRCTQGAIWDVVVDVRPESPSYLRHFGVELSAANHRQIYIPRGVAHGFQTLEDGCEVHYQMSEFYAPDAQRGFRWDDPAVGIKWPLPDPILNDRDRSYPDLVPAPHATR